MLRGMLQILRETINRSSAFEPSFLPFPFSPARTPTLAIAILRDRADSFPRIPISFAFPRGWRSHVKGRVAGPRIQKRIPKVLSGKGRVLSGIGRRDPRRRRRLGRRVTRARLAPLFCRLFANARRNSTPFGEFRAIFRHGRREWRSHGLSIVQ